MRVSNKECTYSLIELEEQIKKLEENLNTFKIAEDYNEIQIKADKEKENFLK